MMKNWADKTGMIFNLQKLALGSDPGKMKFFLRI